MSLGFSQATVQRMTRYLEAFEVWTKDKLGLVLSEALATAEMADLALRGYGCFCFPDVYAITGVVHQYPSNRNLLHGAWQVDRKWQLEEPGQCRAVLSVPLVRAIIAAALLWEWRSFPSIVALGFAGMLHPNEFVHLIRSDLVFPKDTLELRERMYVHIRNPKTARFARRQHVRIDDTIVISLDQRIFGHLQMKDRLLDASMAVFRREWNSVLDHLEVPRQQALRGATPGTLRGSGATHLCLTDMDLSKIAWKGRWSKLRTLDYYIQEVGAQLFLHQLPVSATYRITELSAHIDV